MKRRRLPTTLAFLSTTFAPVLAQQQEGQASWTLPTPTKAVSIERLRLQCPENSPEACAYSYPVQSTACEAVGLDDLGVLDETPYRFARYLFSTTYQESASESWTCEADAALLVEVQSDSTALPVWADATERTYEFIRDASLAEHGDADLFSVQHCMNGTGGCADWLLIREDGVWRRLEKDSTWDRVYSQLPAGYRPHKSPAMDIRNLTWEQHIAGLNDANCCPSGKILLDLEIVNGMLSVKKAVIEADLSLE